MSRYWSQQSVIIKRKTLAHCKQHKITYKLKPSSTKFKFGDGVFSSLGTIQIRIPTLNCSFLKINVNVVPAHVPLLLRLDILDSEQLVANNVQHELQATHHGWSMPLTRKHGPPTSRGIRNQSFHKLGNHQAESALQASCVREIVRSYETCETEPSL